MAMFCRYGVPVMTIKMLMKPNIDLGNEVEMGAMNKTYRHSLVNLSMRFGTYALQENNIVLF